MAIRRRDQLDAILRSIEKLDNETMEAARRIIETVGTADVERLRSALEQYLLPAAEVGASAAAELGAMAYNQWRYEDLGEKIEAVAVSAYDKGKFMSAINAAVKKAASGATTEDILGTLSGRIGYTSRTSYSNSLFANGKRDPKKPRYARCPASGEACQFCLMLASRGFEYSKGKLGEKVHNHDNCKCTYTCSWDKRPAAQGYDDRRYYREWRDSIEQEAKQRAERNGTTVGEERKAIMQRYADKSAEYKKRDALTPQSGASKNKPTRLHRVVDYDTPPENVSMHKQWDKMTEHEKAGTWHVSRSGAKDIKALDEDPDAKANFDFKIGGRVWEMKNVTNPGSSVSNQIKRARAKWLKTGRSDNMRVVITTEGLEGKFDDVLDSVESKLRQGETAIVYDEDGNAKKIKK